MCVSVKKTQTKILIKFVNNNFFAPNKIINLAQRKELFSQPEVHTNV